MSEIHKEKLNWMAVWAMNHNCALELNGEVGFGRPCVGITVSGTYPDYEWYDDDYNRIDKNGNIWLPPNAYHKHPCVAVLGKGEKAEEQLYDWLKWFDNNNFSVIEIENPNADSLNFIEVAMGRLTLKQMVKNT